MKADYVLFGINGVDDALLADVGRERQLDQDAVYGDVAVVPIDKFEQFRLRDISGTVFLNFLESQPQGGLHLERDIAH